MVEMLGTLSILCLVVVSEAVTCNFPQCICLQLQSISYFCNEPVQDLSGYGRQLSEIEPGTFSQASFVTSLSLANNAPLLLLPESFQGLTNVTLVDLSGNDIESLPDNVFSPMASLTSLNLSSNALSTLNPQAFAGLNGLLELSLGGNMLTQLPVAELFDAAPSLSRISLYPNPIDCNAENITELFLLVRSGVIIDGDQLSCSNGSNLTDLNFDLTPTTTSPLAPATTVTTTTTSPTVPTVTTVTTSPTVPTVTTATTSPTVPTVTTATTSPTVPTVTTATISPTAPTVTTATISPTVPPQQYCPAETTILQTGYFDWPLSLGGTNATTACRNGPQGGVASRYCSKSGKWSLVEDSRCNEASVTVQQLATLSQVTITAETSATVASQLARVTSDPSGISVAELATVVSIADQLIQVGGNQVQVLNETLQAIDSLVNISRDTLNQASPEVIASLRDILDSLLLGALSADKTDIVLNFPNLAVGGAYLPPTSDGRLLAIIHQNTQNGVETIEVGGANGDGDVLVDIEGGVANSSIQLTVYSGNEFFTNSNCSNNSQVGGDILGPIISVVNERTSPRTGDDEVITIRYNQLSDDRTELVCVRWTTDQECVSGRWVTSGCSLTRDRMQRVILCRCLEEGTYAIIDFSTGVGDNEPTVTAPPDEEAIARIVFYALSSLPLILYLTVAMTVIVHSQLRSGPICQVLLGLSLSQGLTHLFLMLSYELSQVTWLCYTLAMVFHYLTLASLTWMTWLPVVTVVKVFKRIWYERAWLTAPFAAIAIVWPAVPVAIYGGVRFSAFNTNSPVCWLEASLFPNTFTYLFGITCVITMATQLLSLLLLCCSDYSVEPSTYLQLGAAPLNTLSFSLSIILTFFTASAHQFNITPHYVLLATSLSVLISGVVFLIIFGVCKPKIRSAMLCRKERDKTAHYASTWHSGSERRRSSAMSLILRGRRPRVQVKDDTNINYIDDYLGLTHSPPKAAPIPLAMFGQVHPQGRVRRNPELGGVVSGHGVGHQRRHAHSSEA